MQRITKALSQGKETDPCFQVPFENLYQFFLQHLELDILESAFYCCTDALETEVIPGKLRAASGFCTASFSKEAQRSISWSLAMALLYSIFTILSSQTWFLCKAPSQGTGFQKCFYFSPTLLSFSIFRPQLHPVAYSSRIPNICQIREMLCGVSSWFLVHKCWRCVHWQKGVGMGGSAAGGGQGAFWLISALFPMY